MDAVRNAAKPQRDMGHAFTAVLFALFVVVLLLAMLAGTLAYSALCDMRTAADESRLGINLIANTVRANDAYASVTTADGPEGQALVLVEEETTGVYETRLYLYQGHVVEEYSLAGTEFTPQRATELCASSQFSFTFVNDTLAITTDQGTATVALRSSQEVA